MLHFHEQILSCYELSANNQCTLECSHRPLGVLKTQGIQQIDSSLVTTPRSHALFIVLAFVLTVVGNVAGIYTKSQDGAQIRKALTTAPAPHVRTVNRSLIFCVTELERRHTTLLLHIKITLQRGTCGTLLVLS